jgi:hypothetical protein
MTVSTETSLDVVEMLSAQRPGALQDEINSRRHQIDRLLEQIERWRCETTRNLSQLQDQQRILDSALHAQNDGSYAQQLLDSWEQLQSHPRLHEAAVRVSSNDLEQQSLFLVTTHDLRLYRSDTNESRWLGAFEIELTFMTGAIKMRNLDTRRGGRDHPHVVDQTPCFGAHSHAFAQLMSKGDLVVLYELLIQYIETLNLEDEWGRYGAYWFEVDDEWPPEESEGQDDRDGRHLEAVAA